MDKKSVNVKYTLEITEPAAHYFDISIEIDDFIGLDNYIDLKLPVWRPGRYLIFDFASYIQNFKATDIENNILKWEKTDKCTWRVYADFPGTIDVSYKVYANEFNLRTKGLDDNHAFVNPTAVFMFPEKLRNQPLTLQIKPFKDWQVSTGMDYVQENIFYAESYDKFADSPLEIGNHIDYDFNVDGKKHIITFYGKARYEIKKMINDFTKIIKENYHFWGNVPYKKYIFIIHCTPVSSGGTEHNNSTIVGVKTGAFETAAGYVSFLRLISHEFFHTWNIKQLKPAGLTPYEYTKENYTSELWIAEGGTSYYDGLMLTRTGQVPLGEFFKEITSAVEDERRRPGYRVQSVAESSFDAWVKFWRFTPGAYNSESDYYVMGSYACLVLDLLIRNSSKNKHSLDSVFKAMYERFPLDKKGYTNDDFKKVCEEFSGISLKYFFDEHIFGTKPIDWDKYLLYAGLNLSKIEHVEQPVIGLFLSETGDKITVTSVLPGSPADKSGIIKGDEIIACDGLKLSFKAVEKKIKSMKGGEKLEISVFRANKLKIFILSLSKHSIETYKLEKVESPTNLQKDIYEKWLNAKW